MTITEPQRLALHAAARTALGDEEGDTLMATLPPANTEIATRQDLAHHAAMTRNDLERVETSLRNDIERVETSLRTDLGRVEGLLGPLEDRMGARIAQSCGDVRDQLTRRIHASELRTMAFIGLAFLADRMLG